MYKDTDMQDRQDIDALLMGALYGELSHAESNRLEAHMAVHPQDRLVLDGLTRARKAIRDSHVLTVHAEPPAAVSAMVLQEAARRAPARRVEHGGGVARFLAAFTAAFRHPAMAAAAVVVLVAGVAGTLYLKNDQALIVEREIAAPTAASAPSQAAEAAPEPTPDRNEGVPVLAPPATFQDPELTVGKRGYVAALDEKPVALEEKAAALTSALHEQEAQEARPPSEDRGKLADKRPAPAKSRGIAVTTAEPTIKLAPTAGKRSDDDGLSVARDGRFSQQPPPVAAVTADSTTVAVDSGPSNQLDMRLGGDAPASDRERAKRAAPAAPAPARPQVAIGAGGRVGVAPSSGATASVGKPADVVAKKNADAARALHRKLVGLVKANKCDLASKTGADLYARYPDYYAEFVKNDRAVKACRPHIENENRKRRAQNMKTRVQGDSYEAEAPSPTAK